MRRQHYKKSQDIVKKVGRHKKMVRHNTALLGSGKQGNPAHPQHSVHDAVTLNLALFINSDGLENEFFNTTQNIEVIMKDDTKTVKPKIFDMIPSPQQNMLKNLHYDDSGAFNTGLDAMLAEINLAVRETAAKTLSETKGHAAIRFSVDQDNELSATVTLYGDKKDDDGNEIPLTIIYFENDNPLDVFLKDNFIRNYADNEIPIEIAHKTMLGLTNQFMTTPFREIVDTTGTKEGDDIQVTIVGNPNIFEYVMEAKDERSANLIKTIGEEHENIIMSFIIYEGLLHYLDDLNGKIDFFSDKMEDSLVGIGQWDQGGGYNYPNMFKREYNEIKENFKTKMLESYPNGLNAPEGLYDDGTEDPVRNFIEATGITPKLDYIETEHPQKFLLINEATGREITESDINDYLLDFFNSKQKKFRNITRPTSTKLKQWNSGDGRVLTRENITAQRIFDTNDRILTRENITAQRIFEPVEVDVVSELEKVLAALTKEKEPIKEPVKEVEKAVEKEETAFEDIFGEKVLTFEALFGEEKIESIFGEEKIKSKEKKDQQKVKERE